VAPGHPDGSGNPAVLILPRPNGKLRRCLTPPLIGGIIAAMCGMAMLRGSGKDWHGFRPGEVQQMTAWRMSFRAGTNGPEMWDQYCRPLKVAAIEYGPVDDIDFSSYTSEE